MKINRINDVDEFHEIAFQLLGTQEIENCLILSLLNRLKINSNIFGSEDPHYYILEEESEVVSVAMQTPPHNIILSYPFSDEGIEVLVEYLAANKIKFPGAIGENIIVTKFAESWSKRSSLENKVLARERIYQLTEVDNKYLELKGKEFKLAEINQLECIIEWMHGFGVDALPDFNDTLAEFQVAKETFYREAIKNGECFFLSENDQPLCFVRTPGVIESGRMINSVYTPELLRGKGYATEAVAHLSQKILEQGSDYCALYTDLDNPTSNSIYQKIGYRPVIDQLVIKFF